MYFLLLWTVLFPFQQVFASLNDKFFGTFDLLQDRRILDDDNEWNCPKIIQLLSDQEKNAVNIIYKRGRADIARMSSVSQRDPKADIAVSFQIFQDSPEEPTTQEAALITSSINYPCKKRRIVFTLIDEEDYPDTLEYRNLCQPYNNEYSYKCDYEKRQFYQ